MSTNARLKPKQTYVCSTKGCAARVVLDPNAWTRKEGAAQVRDLGWTLHLGEAICDRCVAAELLTDLEQSVAVLDTIAAAKKAGGAR